MSQELRHLGGGRAQRVAQAQGLRAEGLKLREIGERMDVSFKTVSSWLCDPDLAKARARREGYRGRCMDCGAPTDGSGGRGRGPLRCASCDVANRLVPGVKARSAVLRALVEGLWAEGKTSVEIAQAVGYRGQGKHYVCHCRSKGFDLPYRRTGEALEHIVKAARKNIVIARAALRQKAATDPPSPGEQLT